MGEILDTSSRKMATIDDDGIVKDLTNIILGSVSFTGEVFNAQRQKVGYFQEDGYIYDEDTKRVGRAENNGNVYDYENQLVGKVKGSHTTMAAAALLLIVR